MSPRCRAACRVDRDLWYDLPTPGRPFQCHLHEVQKPEWYHTRLGSLLTRFLPRAVAHGQCWEAGWQFEHQSRDPGWR